LVATHFTVYVPGARRINGTGAARADDARHHHAVAKWKHFCSWRGVATARYSGHCADLQMGAIRDAGRTERTTMSWADPVIATALAVLAERTATAARTFVAGPSRWNPQDVWLTRVNLRQFDRPRSRDSLPYGESLR
jgi:hypothetical protein